MAYKQDEIIYLLTTEDVKNVARELRMPLPKKNQYQSIRKCVERSFAYGASNWHDVIVEALAESTVSDVRKRPHGRPVRN